MADTLSTLSIISFVLAAVIFAVAIALWFFFDIPTVIGDLTGRTAKKSIAKMRAENEKSGAKVHKESKINDVNPKKSEIMSEIRVESNVAGDHVETGLLTANKAESTENEETGLLNNEATGLLDADETGMLDDENDTVLLEGSTYTEKRVGGKTLTIIEEVMLIHTDEVIRC